MKLIGWAANVNQIILDSTTVTVGEGATVSDTIESSGQKRFRLACSNPPDKYNVKMAFDCMAQDKNGLTELERFYAWLKWAHCFGLNPFQFPAILLNSNRKRNYLEHDSQDDHGGHPVIYNKKTDYEYYTITSTAEAQKSGNSMEVSMTWQTYSSGYIKITDTETEIDHISASNGCVAVFYKNTLSSYPAVNSFTLTVDGAAEKIKRLTYDGEQTVYLYFSKKTEAGTYRAQVGGAISTFTVEQNR